MGTLLRRYTIDGKVEFMAAHDPSASITWLLAALLVLKGLAVAFAQVLVYRGNYTGKKSRSNV